MKAPKKQNNSALYNSLKIVNSILSESGRPNETHVLLQNGWALAHNGILGIGEKILEDLNICTNAKMLEAGLSKCGQHFSITQQTTQLSVKSDKFRALIPCMPAESLNRPSPDAPCALIGEALRIAVAAVAPLALEGQDSVVTASLLIKNGTVVATDRKVIIQHFHGIDLPEIAIPKAIIGPLVKNPKKLAKFGFSRSSCTFYFEDESWLKSQFYDDKWPDVNAILNRAHNALTLPEGFYDAVKALEPFSEDGFVYFDTNKMLSHPDESKGASFEVYGLPKGPAFNIKQLKMIEPYASKVDFMAQGNNGSKQLMFFSELARGAIAGRV
jgi:hypothetical protein